jgi:predicted outer membrane repeat protein
MRIDNSNPYLNNVVISNNSASNGGGIYLNYSETIIEHAVIHGNSSSYGGGIYCQEYGSPTLVNVTIYGNEVPEWGSGGGILCAYGSSPIVTNSILWDNQPTEVEYNHTAEDNDISISFSDVIGGINSIITNNGGTVYWLDGNIDEDPLFENVSENNFHLTGLSPCIDAGDPNTLLDPDNTISDMGAYYFHHLVFNAIFSAQPLSGYSPLIVNFFDESFGNPTSWEWDFNNNGIIDSYNQHPTFTYNQSGIYSVKLTISDGINEDTLIREDFISVIEPMNADFTGIPLSGNSPLEVVFSDLSLGNPTTWLWDFDNDGFIDSNEQNPTYVYEYIGIYTVSLTVSDGNDDDNEIKVDYIDVTGTGSQNQIIPHITFLCENYPNPFNPVTNFQFSIKKNETGVFAIYNTRGQLLESHQYNSGHHNVNWDASKCSSGVYLYKLKTDSFSKTNKMLLLK